MSFKKGGFGNIAGNSDAARRAIHKKLGRKPRTAKEHGDWRQKQRKTFVLWRSHLDEE